MKTGHYLVTKPIPLASPFESGQMPIAANFDILAVAPEYVLIRYEGIRVWKTRSHIEGSAVCTTEMVVANDGYRMVPAPVIDNEPEIVWPWAPHMRRAKRPLSCA